MIWVIACVVFWGFCCRLVTDHRRNTIVTELRYVIDVQLGMSKCLNQIPKPAKTTFWLSEIVTNIYQLTLFLFPKTFDISTAKNNKITMILLSSSPYPSRCEKLTQQLSVVVVVYIQICAMFSREMCIGDEIDAHHIQKLHFITERERDRDVGVDIMREDGKMIKNHGCVFRIKMCVHLLFNLLLLLLLFIRDHRR